MRPKSPNYYQKNIMVKRILLSIVLLLVIAYLVVAVTAFNRKPTSQVCQDVELVIKDTVYAGFITKKEVATLLEKKGISPIGKDLERVRTKTLERELAKHPLIDQVECYKTPSGKLCIEVTQRTPILRVMSANGENYYLDNKGTVMPPDAKCVAHLAIVTGRVEKSFAMRDLYKFGVFLQNNKFWDAQIEQIHVLSDKNVELVPRVGDHIIYLGKLDGFERKLERVKAFYERGLNQVGTVRRACTVVGFTVIRHVGPHVEIIAIQVETAGIDAYLLQPIVLESIGYFNILQAKVSTVVPVACSGSGWVNSSSPAWRGEGGITSRCPVCTFCICYVGCRTECREIDFTGYIGYSIELGKATEAFPLKTERGIIGVLRCTGILIRSTVVVVNYTVTVEVYNIVVAR